MDINEVAESTCNEINVLESPSGGNEVPIDNQQIDNELPIDENNEPEVLATNSSSTPMVGMKFNSEIEAYDFYNGYARRLGFSIKKFHMEHRKDETLKYRSFVCNKQGLRQQHRTHITKKPQPITRTNCMARVEFKINTNDEWTLWKLELNHNHDMISPNKIHMGRSQRKIQPYQRCIINQMTDAGIKDREIYNYFQGGVNTNEVGFIRANSINYIHKRRRKNLDYKEAQGILQYLKKRQVVDKSFFYSIQIQESGEITNFFWADGITILDYAYFGDVISFDTTFQTNKYDMPFAPIIGVNHHKQSIIFGAALLFDETTDTFVWLFETFLTAMSGKQPVTIFTYKSAAISKAIEIVMPNSAHQLCLWHLFNNATINMSHVIHDFPSFLKDLKHCVYERCTIEAFEKIWDDLLKKYNVIDNKWLKNFYQVREKWAACYRITSFCAGMTTTQRSESMNNHFKKCFKTKLSMFNFLDKYDKAIKLFREKEISADFKSRNSAPIDVFGNIRMLRDAGDMYTKVMYDEFLQQYMKSMTCICNIISSDASTITYSINSEINGREELLSYTLNEVT